MRLDFILIQRRLLRVAHAHRSSVDDDVKAEFLQVGPFQSSGPGGASQFLGLCEGAVQNINFGSSLLEPKHCGPRCAACTQNQYLCAFDGDPLLQWTHHAGRVRVEAVQISVLRTDHRIARADLGGVGIGVIEVRQNRGLIRHGDRKTMKRDITDAGQ